MFIDLSTTAQVVLHVSVERVLQLPELVDNGRDRVGVGQEFVERSGHPLFGSGDGFAPRVRNRDVNTAPISCQHGLTSQQPLFLERPQQY